MFKKIENHPRFDFGYTFEVDIDPNNRWVKLSKMIPWKTIEERYADNFKKLKGRKAKPIRVALGALIIQQKCGFTDQETVDQITENPYLQYFIGLTEYQKKPPFDPSLMVHFRKRFTPEMLAEINTEIISGNNDDGDDPPPGGKKAEAQKPGGDPFVKYPPNKGKLILDATCAPADIRYPMDLSLLNEAREKLDNMIDLAHSALGKPSKRPRTYRRKARRAFLKMIRNKKPKRKPMRKAIGQQLRFVKRNRDALARLLDKAAGNRILSPRQLEALATIDKLYMQQLTMYKDRTHHVENRIVSISQPHVRPIVRGKSGVPVEFGAKVAISVVDGFAHIEKLGWEAFNESTTFIDSVESYRRRYGCYPEAVQADKIYRTRLNFLYCEGRGIRLSGPRLGRPPTDEARQREQLRLERLDNRERNTVEGKFGEGKRRYGMDLIMAKLQNTAECVIWLQIMVMNMERRLRIFMLIFLQRIFVRNLASKLIAA